MDFPNEINQATLPERIMLNSDASGDLISFIIAQVYQRYFETCAYPKTSLDKEKVKFSLPIKEIFTECKYSIEECEN